MLRELFANWVRLIRSKYRRVDLACRNRRQVNRDGWDQYARTWDMMKEDNQIPDLKSTHCGKIQYLGDEWSLMEDTEFPYGLGDQSVEDFLNHMYEKLLRRYLPTGNELKIMEIGPGGGRITQLLLPRCQRLYAVDISREMLRRLERRFQNESKINAILTDGREINGVPPNTLDAAVSFDTFVHLEPWEIFRYLEMIRRLLSEKGIGIVHFADVETPIGFRLFRYQISSVLEGGVDFATFSVMSKGIMERFLKELGFEIISITNEVVPRDAVAIFRQGEIG